MGIIEPLSVRLRMLDQIHQGLKKYDRYEVSRHVVRQLFNFAPVDFFHPVGVNELNDFCRNFGYKYREDERTGDLIFTYDETSKDGLKSDRYKNDRE